MEQEKETDETTVTAGECLVQGLEMSSSKMDLQKTSFTAAMKMNSINIRFEKVPPQLNKMITMLARKGFRSHQVNKT